MGTPTWFGFGPLNLTENQILEIGSMSALIHSIAALIIPLIALRFIVSSKEIIKNIRYIYLSIFSCTVPYFLLAQVNYEFPALVGGAIGLFISIFLANRGIGLEKTENALNGPVVNFPNVVKALFIRNFRHKQRVNSQLKRYFLNSNQRKL